MIPPKQKKDLSENEALRLNNEDLENIIRLIIPHTPLNNLFSSSDNNDEIEEDINKIVSQERFSDGYFEKIYEIVNNTKLTIEQEVDTIMDYHALPTGLLPTDEEFDNDIQTPISSEEQERKPKRVTLKDFTLGLENLFNESRRDLRAELTQMCKEACETLATPGERKVFISRLESQIRQTYGTTDTPITPTFPKIMNDEDYYNKYLLDENDKKMTALKWIELKWGHSLIYFKNKLGLAIKHDHLYQDELRNFDPKLMTKLGNERKDFETSEFKLRNIVPPKSERNKIELEEIPKAITRSASRIQGVKSRQPSNPL